MLIGKKYNSLFNIPFLNICKSSCGSKNIPNETESEVIGDFAKEEINNVKLETNTIPIHSSFCRNRNYDKGCIYTRAVRGDF